ncbi:MAG TPA: deoxynucleoside kinase [Chitinophagales bacterium]|nr:deoxynucleoside kinase [Chitinophagales bacterium]
MQYKIITIEGNIGSGKTSLAKKLAQQYNTHLVLETFADNPFLQKFFEKQQDYALGMEMFFMAERYEQFNNEIEIHLPEDKPIILDYLFTKSLIFAKANLDTTEFNLFKKIFDILNPKLPSPDLIIYLHSEPKRLIENIKFRGREFEQTVQLEYLKKIEEAYFERINNLNGAVKLIVDVTHADFIENENQYNRISAMVENFYPMGLHHILID